MASMGLRVSSSFQRGTISSLPLGPGGPNAALGLKPRLCWRPLRVEAESRMYTAVHVVGAHRHTSVLQLRFKITATL